MSNRFAFVSEDTDFLLLKAQGVTEVLIKLSPKTIKSVQILYENAGKISEKSGEVRYVGVKDLKKLLKNIEAFYDDVFGFIVPVPEISGPIWNSKLAKMCRMDEENCETLYDLFDDETEISSVRWWYYKNFEKYILRTYMIPLKKFCDSIGKEIIFDLGNIEMQYDLMKNMINPELLKNAGISLAVHKGNEILAKELGFSYKDFVITGDFIERIKSNEVMEKILLIKSVRGVKERFRQGEIKGRLNRLETPALSAAIESVYYCEMLSKKGYEFDVKDEEFLSKGNDYKKYDNILICKSCLFTEKETKIIDKIQKDGIKINDNELILSLMEKGED